MPQSVFDARHVPAAYRSQRRAPAGLEVSTQGIILRLASTRVSRFARIFRRNASHSERFCVVPQWPGSITPAYPSTFLTVGLTWLPYSAQAAIGVFVRSSPCAKQPGLGETIPSADEGIPLAFETNEGARCGDVMIASPHLCPDTELGIHSCEQERRHG